MNSNYSLTLNIKIVSENNPGIIAYQRQKKKMSLRKLGSDELLFRDQSKT